ncbi:MAG TPA: CoA transferase, partial [Hyphomicrobiaceae bacterium]|nr:CoA transferase [Hyphomicrobiaceae bacterium]
NAGEVPGQAGNNHPTSVPTGVFKTRDGYINIATAGGQMWERLCKAIDAPALLANPQFATARARLENRDALNRAIEAHLAHRTSADWIERLNAAGVPTGAINSIEQVFADPQVAHLGVVQQIETGDARGALKVVGQPVSLGRTPTRLAAPPPERGQHTLEVLSEFGFTAAEIAALREEKVI